MVWWLAIFIFALIIEAMTTCLVSIWFSAGALLAFFAGLLGAPLPIQIVIFFVTSILLIALTKPFVTKLLSKNKHKTNIDTLIGKQAIVTVKIDNLNGVGQVKVEGKTWTARDVDNRIIELEEVVIIERIEGVKLIVRKN